MVLAVWTSEPRENTDHLNKGDPHSHSSQCGVLRWLTRQRRLSLSLSRGLEVLKAVTKGVVGGESLKPVFSTTVIPPEHRAWVVLGVVKEKEKQRKGQRGKEIERGKKRDREGERPREEREREQQSDRVTERERKREKQGEREERDLNILRCFCWRIRYRFCGYLCSLSLHHCCLGYIHPRSQRCWV